MSVRAALMHGVSCANCRSKWIQSLSWETGYSVAMHRCRCPECGTEWIDNYDWESREHLVEPENLPPEKEREETQ